MIKRQESEASRKLFVAGLNVASMEGDLGEYFKKFGKVNGSFMEQTKGEILKIGDSPRRVGLHRLV